MEQFFLQGRQIGEKKMMEHKTADKPGMNLKGIYTLLKPWKDEGEEDVSA